MGPYRVGRARDLPASYVGVHEGKSLRGALLRAVLVGMAMIGRARARHEVLSTVDDGVRALVGRGAIDPRELGASASCGSAPSWAWRQIAFARRAASARARANEASCDWKSNWKTSHTISVVPARNTTPLSTAKSHAS